MCWRIGTCRSSTFISQVDSDADSEWESIQTAEWRGMQSLACLCLAFGTGKAALPGFSSHSLLAAQLRWLTATDTDEVRKLLHLCINCIVHDRQHCWVDASD